MNSNNLNIVDSKLKQNINETIDEKWWLKKKYQPKGHQHDEIERSMNKIIEIFNNKWVEDILDKLQKDQRKNHLMIRYLTEIGSYHLSILIELGNNLIKIESVKNIEYLIKELKNPTKFVSTAFETEIAAECIRKGFTIELYPELCGKNPDLKIILDSKIVYFEITEIHPSQKINSFNKLLNNLFEYIHPLILENTRIRLIPSKLISNRQCNQIKNRLKHVIKNSSSFPTSFQVNDLMVEVEKEKDEWGKSLFMEIPSEIINVELKRLKEKIKKKVRQINGPNLGVIVIDATNTLSSTHCASGLRIKERIELTSNLNFNVILKELEPFDNKTEKEKNIEIISKIKNNIIEIFEENDYSNILAVIVIRLFKFFETENEVIIVENPYCKEPQLFKMIKELNIFSRTIYL